jgi:hypothetical protein
MNAPQATHGIAHIEFRRILFGTNGFFGVSAGVYRFLSVLFGISGRSFLEAKQRNKNQGLLHAPRTTQQPALSESFTLFYGILR